MTIIVTEVFNTGSGNLSTRAGWTKPHGLDNLFHDGGSLLQSAANYNQAAYYLHDAVPPSANYAVESDVRWHANGSGGSVGVLARFSAAAVTGYRLRIGESTTAPQITLHRINAGVFTSLGSYTAFTSEAGVINTLRLEVEGNNIRAYRNGALVIDVTDASPITAVGQSGLSSYRFHSVSTRFRVNDFEVVSLGDAPVRRRSPLMLTPW